ncbi:MAG: PTS fructose transporter subunit EIIC [Clostridium sp.]|uniref:PTS fructose transporter subunit EIIC n=1 Tax=Clostridium sp. TaxID=1506 RepID=UPI0025BE3526|nr:PTS fructose transporter subunit EIIC [Clostridium sp.]MCH3964956.1 PTS fructose transporter subunit EIIC [Clostridium sp.]MCI1716550.1 PTS fructose transporter subunit EIIC [Clostridium sp.]MCI1800968.1 PTS fructose transporter subunit EIIC [Clostridium sp.]MCI1814727.1 PTS fructose transporter subunit EIIC [Clostridium sp.]MCI1871715.1 PTS fructose transporter subunit EIIC [Clostridium sp.]
MLELLKDTKKHLLTGVSYMIPFVVAGGVLLAVSVMLSGQAAVPKTGFLKSLSDIGIAGLTLFVPVLGGFIAYSMVDKPGIGPGMIAAYLANAKGGGFLGGMIAGLLAGIIVYYLKKIKVPDVMRSVMPIFIIPLVGTFIAGSIIVLFLGQPIADLMAALNIWLKGMQGSSKVILGIILGAMITFDMGGPLNKTAFFFAVALIQTHPELMAAVAVPVCTPPLGLGLASLLFKKKFSTEEREAGKAALIMGCIGISEGAIPFAAADPIRVIPSIMVGGAVSSVISLFFGATNHAPWGGLIVLPIVGNRIGYFIAVVVGVIVTALMVSILKKPADQVVESSDNDDDSDDIDLDFE